MSHGFITVEGETMSKSLGNGIHPKEIINKLRSRSFLDIIFYGTFRHMMTVTLAGKRSMKPTIMKLANELGNAVQRTVVMIQKYQDGVIGDIPPASHDNGKPFAKAIEVCKFDRALDEIWQQVRGLNQYIDEEKTLGNCRQRRQDSSARSSVLPG